MYKLLIIPHLRKQIVALAIAVAMTMSAASQGIAEKTKIGLVKTPLSGPIFIALEKGYFVAEGLDADLVFFEAAQPVALAVVSGDIEFGATALTAGLYGLGGQGALRIIGSQGFEAPGFLALAIVVSNSAFGAGLTSLTALPGHSVAITQVGSANHYGLALIGEKYGFDLKSIRVLPLQSLSNEVSAVIGGQADAAALPFNSIAQAINDHNVKLLSYDGEEWRRQLGAIFCATRVANERSDTIGRFLRAFRKGAREYHDAFTGAHETRADGPTAPEITKIIARYVQQSPETIRFGLGYVDPEARVDVNDIKHQVGWFQSQGMLKSSVNADAIIDARYAGPLPQRP